MTVSVIMPVRDGERYLEEAACSVLAQTHGDLELLLIDDGSRDRTPEIARGLMARDPRVRVLSAGGVGVSAARNLGLDEASGEWIFFCDSDDLLPPEALQVLLQAAGDGTDLVVGAHALFGNLNAMVWPETPWPALSGAEMKNAAALRLIEGDSVLNIMCNKLHRRENLERYRIRLNPGVAIAEDALFNLEAVFEARTISYVHHVTYHYRMHAASAMGNVQGSQLEIHLPWLRALRTLLVRTGRLEQYYGAFVDSACLRLYKDGGIPLVVREFNEKILPLTDPAGLMTEKMSRRDRALARAVAAGTFPGKYPARCLMQIAERKREALLFQMRKKREREALEKGMGYGRG